MTGRTQKILIALSAAFLIVMVAVSLMWGIAVAISWRAAERAGNEAATIQNLKTIAAVEIQYFNTHGRTYATFDQLVREQLLSSKFGARPTVADGYLLTLELNKPTAYTMTADPTDRSSGKRHFYLDSASMQIRVNPDGPAGPNDPIQ